MARTNEKTDGALKPLEKAPSGIEGLDEITSGGLPRGRPTLVCGGAGTGKTLMALQFLVKGIIEHDEPGVFIAFEETEEELARNVASLGFDLEKLVRQKRLFIDYVRVERREIEETGEYDLEGLFVRIDYAIKTVGDLIISDLGLPDGSGHDLIRRLRNKRPVKAIAVSGYGDGERHRPQLRGRVRGAPDEADQVQ
jgi:CheY-like chemotaxis protein